jgi:FAD-dependent urate hydroxylase
MIIMELRKWKALIIGAGVAGPVAAMALQRAGVDPIVYDARGQSDTDGGSYLTVATNGLDALQAIEAHAPVLAASFPTPRAVLRTGAGKLLGVVPIGSTRGEHACSRTIRRAHLHCALREEALRRGVRFEFGKRLAHAEATRGAAVAHFDDGSEAVGDVLIGCDGIHSATRHIIDPAAPDPRYVGLLNFGGYTRGVSPVPPGAWHMIFGKRAFFGYVSDGAEGTAWFANTPRHPSTRAERDSTAGEDWKRWLVDLFSDDCGPATALIEAGALELAADNTHDLPCVPTWHRGRMIIIGDAAHAPSPTSGQGASMAIEDAVVLAKCLRDLQDGGPAFTVFERLRRRRVERIVAAGARGSSRKAPGPLGRVLRDLLLPLVFRYLVTEKSARWMYDHHIEWERPITVDGDAG